MGNRKYKSINIIPNQFRSYTTDITVSVSNHVVTKFKGILKKCPPESVADLAIMAVKIFDIVITPIYNPQKANPNGPHIGTPGNVSQASFNEFRNSQ